MGFVTGIFGVGGDVWGPAGAITLFLAGCALMVAGAATLAWKSRDSIFHRRSLDAARRVALLVIFGAMLIQVVHMFREFQFNAFAAGVAGWTASPYLACLVAAMFRTNPWPPLIACLAVFAHDWLVYYQVYTSTSSTASIAFLWAPLWNVTLVVPFVIAIASYAARAYKNVRAAA